MHKFVCLECGHVFDEDEIVTWQDSRGECWGVPCSEEVGGCPCCLGDFVKTYQCDCCGEWITGEYVKTDDDKRFCENCFCRYELGEEN